MRPPLPGRDTFAGRSFHSSEWDHSVDLRGKRVAMIGAGASGFQIAPAIAGDVAMLANEVTPVLKALRKNGLDVVAIHHHMTDTRPTIYFLHYWGTGPADKLATGFKAAVSELGKSKTVSTASK